MAKITNETKQHRAPSFLRFETKSPAAHPGKQKSGLFRGLDFRNIRKHISPFLLFDWEYFSNELEFE